MFYCIVHHPADIGKTSATLGIFGSTLTSTTLFFGYDSIHDGGLAIRLDISLDIGDGVTEAITYQTLHRFLPLTVKTACFTCLALSRVQNLTNMQSPVG
jgi:hypothetical protein